MNVFLMGVYYDWEISYKLGSDIGDLFTVYHHGIVINNNGAL